MTGTSIGFYTRVSVLIALLSAKLAWSETMSFGEAPHRFEIEFVTIGEPNNSADTRSTLEMGAVDYEFQIAKYETSCFASRAAGAALAPQGEFGFYSPDMCDFDVKENHPAHLSWEHAAQIVNWMNVSSGYSPAYRLSDVNFGSGVRLELWEPGDPGYNPENPTRSSLAKFVISNTDEWHKAAYYDPTTGTYNLWATGNVEPTRIGPEGGTEPNTAVFAPEVGTGFLAEVTSAGGLSSYGTMGQTGNQVEWEEGPFDVNSLSGTRAIRRGANSIVRAEQLLAENSRQRDVSGLAGFRVVAVTPIPEPSSTLLLAIALCTLGAFRRRR